MITTRMTAVALTLAAVAVAVTGCAGSTTAESTAASPTPAATVAASPVEKAPVVSDDPPPSTCPEFAMTAAHMATYWTYLDINVGTTNDESMTLADLLAGSAALQELAPTCAPEAVESIDAFAAAAEAIQPVYTTQPTGDQVQQVDDALAALQDAGARMFTDMGMATYAWE